LKAHVIDGKIFVITSYDLFMYDPVTDLWVTRARMAQAIITTVHSAVVDNKIIVTCLPKETPTRDLYYTYVMIYDPKTDKWSQGAESKFLLSYGGAGATMGIYAPKRVYVLGVMTPGIFDAVPTNRVYDPVKDVWSYAKIMSIARTHFGVAVVDDVLYVIGGILDLSWDQVPEKPPIMEHNGELIHMHLPSQPFVPTAVNEQYVPIGYSATPLTNEPSGSNSSEPFLTYLAIVTIILMVGTVTILFFHFKKRKTVARKMNTKTNHSGREQNNFVDVLYTIIVRLQLEVEFLPDMFCRGLGCLGRVLVFVLFRGFCLFSSRSR
jgi:hypothetical protein